MYNLSEIQTQIYLTHCTKYFDNTDYQYHQM